MIKTNQYKVTTDLSNLEATGLSKLGRWFEDTECILLTGQGKSQNKIGHINKEAIKSSI